MQTHLNISTPGLFTTQRHLFLPFSLLVIMAVAATGLNAEAKDAAHKKWLAGWQETSSMQESRNGAAVYAKDGIIHMIGGMGTKAGTGQDASSGEFSPTTEYARINTGGSLSSWQFGPKLNIERGFFSAVAHGNYLYAIGGARGQNGKELLNSVERAQIKADGTLGEWTLEKTTLNIPRRCIKLAVIGNTIYAFGGYGGILLDTVEKAEINPDGSLGEWLVATDRMTVARYVHDLERVGNGVYNIGGHDKAGGSGIVDVEWSKTEDDGFFQPWRALPSLQTGRFALATAQHNNFIYALGGLSGAAHLDSIERARITGEGELSAWEYTTSMPFSLGGANAIVLDDRIYLLGGSDGASYLNNAFYATFNEQGDIGYWVAASEAEEHKAAIQARKENKVPLPHSAVIIQHFKEPPYSYLQVREDNNNVIWLAAPAQNLQKGNRINFPNGSLMRNFHSKNLNRTFPFILFVSEVRQSGG